MRALSFRVMGGFSTERTATFSPVLRSLSSLSTCFDWCLPSRKAGLTADEGQKRMLEEGGLDSREAGTDEEGRLIFGWAVRVTDPIATFHQRYLVFFFHINKAFASD